MIGQFSRPHSPAQTAKIERFLLLNCCVSYIAKLSQLI